MTIIENFLTNSEDYRLISENANDFIAIINEKLEYEYINEQAYINNLGYSNADMIGKNRMDLVHPDHIKDGINLIKNSFKTGEVAKMEGKFKHKNGHYIWLEVKGTSFFDNERQRKGLLIARDISDRKRAEKKLKESEESLKLLNQKLEQIVKEKTKELNKSEKKYQQFLENLDIGFYSVALDGQILNINRAHKIILGYDPAESLKNEDVREFWQYPEKREDYIKLLLEKGVLKNYLCHAFTKDGKKKVVELNSHLVRDENEKPIRIDGTFIDITEKYNLEKQLKESEERYRLIFENANDLIRVLNDKFEIEYINEKVHKRFLGYLKEDLFGKTHLPFLHPEDRKHATRSTYKILKKGKGSYQVRFKDKNGNYIWFEFGGRVFFNSKGEKKILSIARNIDDRKLTEQKLIKSEKKYREAFKRANFYRDLFAHDINNILHIINSSSELISYQLGDSEKSTGIDDFLNIIRKQVERGAKLVSDVHTLSRIEEEEIHAQPTEICKLMENAIDFVNKSFNDRIIHSNIECAKDHITVNANELLQDVFENILLNGVKYNEYSSVKIGIKVSKIQKDGKNYNKIEFSDNGIGVPDDRKEIIFNRGNRELKGSKGMGLGLSLVKKILKTFNGKVWVEDKVQGDYSRGSNFIILLPELKSSD